MFCHNIIEIIFYTLARKNKDVKKLHAEIVYELKNMLDDNNVFVKSFRMAKENFFDHGNSDVKLSLIGSRGRDARKYNIPSVSEVAALIVGDFDRSLGARDIIVEIQMGHLKRISELHASYLGLQYPLMFPYGEDGYREDINFAETSSSNRK